MQPCKILLFSLLSVVYAVYLDEAYRVDFHKPLLGLPQPPSTFFHQPLSSSKASLLYTLTERNVVGALNPKDGAIVWRHQLISNHTSVKGVLRPVESQDAVVSGLGNTVTAWSSSDGKLLWSRTFGAELVQDVVIVEGSADGERRDSRDVVVLLRHDAGRVLRLDGTTGRTLWKHNDESSDTVHQLSTSTSIIHVISFHSALIKGGKKLSVTNLDSTTGKKSDHIQLSSENEISSPNDVLFVGVGPYLPILVWADRGRTVLKMNSIGSKAVASFDLKKRNGDAADIRVLAPTASTSTPHFLVQYSTTASNWGEVFHLDIKKGTIVRAYEFPAEPGPGAFSAGVADNVVYFNRISGGKLSLASSQSEKILDHWDVNNINVPGLLETPRPLCSASEVVLRSGGAYAVRSAILLASGDWILIQNGRHTWSRSESLATASRAEWAELREIEADADDLRREGKENFIKAYISRTTRHVHQLPKLPEKIREFGQRLLQNLLPFNQNAGPASTGSLGIDSTRIITVETANGRFLGIDPSDTGKILWNVKTQGDDSFQGPHSELLAAAGLGKFELKWSRFGTDRAQSSSATVRYTSKDGILYGYKANAEIWRFVPSKGSKIIKVASALPFEPVASIGKVLGDRNVLYKYLNPNAILLATAETRQKASIHVLDSVSGEVLHSAHFTQVDASRPMTAVMSENWFAVSFVAEPADDASSRGYHLLMAEMYESDIPNDRGMLGSATNYSLLRPNTRVTKPHVVAKVFHVAEEIGNMAVTQTGQGITSRQLILSLSGSNAIVSIPRQVLDPRRVVGKDPTTPQLEEGLSKYSPMVEFDPKWVLNHRQEVLGIKEIVTSPASFESTSLIFAFGLDFFGTRVTPSFAFDILGNSFNKVQLILTVAALLVGVIVVGPLIKRKQTNMLWQNP